MKHRLLEIVVCPECGGTLVASEYDRIDMPGHRGDNSAQEILEGLLKCIDCHRTFPIIRGIPRLLPDDLRHSLWQYHHEFFQRHPDAVAAVFPTDKRADSATAQKEKTYASFSFQRLKLKPPDTRFAKDWLTHFNKRISPHEPSFFKGKLTLDAGCGFGRHLYCASRCGAEVVGIDLSEGVQRAYDANVGDPHVHIVQGDIYRMPFRSETFELAMSFGVLHHLPDPRGGFESIARMLRPDGDALIWVYGYKGMQWTYRLSHLRSLCRITSRMPHWIQYIICTSLALVLELVLWMPSRVLSRYNWTRKLAEHLPAQNNSQQPFSMKVTAVYDRLGTPVTHFHDREELTAWFRDCNFRNFRVFTPDRRGWQATGTKAVSKMKEAQDRQYPAAS